MSWFTPSFFFFPSKLTFPNMYQNPRVLFWIFWPRSLHVWGCMENLSLRTRRLSQCLEFMHPEPVSIPSEMYSFLLPFWGQLLPWIIVYSFSVCLFFFLAQLYIKKHCWSTESKMCRSLSVNNWNYTARVTLRLFSFQYYSLRFIKVMRETAGFCSLLFWLPPLTFYSISMNEFC